MGYLKEKYTKEYFLGSIDKETGRVYGNGGFENFKSGEMFDRYKMFLKNLALKNKTILDIGCGRGEVVDFCARNGARKVVGIDFSSDAIKIAAEFNKNNRNVELLELEAKDINFENMFDVIFALDVIEHIPEEEMEFVYSKMHAALKKSGILIIHTPIYNMETDKDSSDFIPATQGTHCNKQTEKKLSNALVRHKFREYSINIWGKENEFILSAFIYAKTLEFKKFLSRQWERITHPGRTINRLSKKLLKFI